MHGDARVVIVDDSSEDIVLLESVLCDAGVRHVHVVVDPHQALDLFNRIEPDLLLLNLHIHPGDGVGLLAEIVRRAAGAYLPVLALTAADSHDAPRHALSVGAADYLPKPLQADDVRLRVGNLLETRRLHQQLRRGGTTVVEAPGTRPPPPEPEPASRQATCDRVLAALAGDAFQMAFQPVADLRNGATLGHEALARFDIEPQRSPKEWFADAAEVGLGCALELSAVSRALDALPHLPAGTFLSVNASAETLLHPRLLELVDPDIAARVVIELTEHVPVEDYGPVVDAFARLRVRGVRLAVDDTGAGFAGFRHILALAPDIIKLDSSLVRGIELDPARRALTAALVAFAADTGVDLLAQGVETFDELDTLTELGVRWAQGYLLGRPKPLAQSLHLA